MTLEDQNSLDCVGHMDRYGQHPFETAILIIFWKRYSTALEVIARIRPFRPLNLFLACDGPREANSDDSLCILEARRAIEAAIDWPCSIVKRYSSVNQGSKYGIVNAIDWFFSLVNEGIILEDDCLPEASFLPFCSTLLDRYRHDSRIWSISGTNLLGESPTCQSTYLFSRYSLGCWGWATWRRCWQSYDPELENWPNVRSSGELVNAFDSEEELNYWSRIWDGMHDWNYPQTWDYQWHYAHFCNGGLSVVPRLNQVSNIGYGASGTHCTDDTDIFANLPTFPLEGMIHPFTLLSDRSFDRELYDKFRQAEGKAPHGKFIRLWLSLFFTIKGISGKFTGSTRQR